MKIVKQSAVLMRVTDYPESLIEVAGRVCYRSERKINRDSEGPFIRRLIERGHESVLEHASATFRIVCDRATANQIVRHRIASYSQESTRYCNYAKDGITVIRPLKIHPDDSHWKTAMLVSETRYRNLIKSLVPPEAARSVLPLCLATQLVTTMNFRSWRNFLKARLAPDAQAEVRELAASIWKDLSAVAPNCFHDLEAK